jgi:hypothetical protein
VQAAAVKPARPDPQVAIRRISGIGSRCQLDFTVLNRGEKIAGLAGVLLILVMFIFDWFSVKVGVNRSESRDAWGSYGFTDVLLFIAGLAAIVLALLAASDVDVGLPVAMSAIVTALGILSLILMIISLITPPSFLPASGGLDYDVKAGAWLGLIATAAVTSGGYLAMQEEGTSFADEAERFRSKRTGGSGGPGAGAPPPPPSSSPRGGDT